MNSICIFGDSVAKGVIYDKVKQRYIFLKDCFASLFSKQVNVPITNYAKFGCTVTKGVEIVEKHEQELSKYDYIALEFGGNDCDFNWADVSKDPDREHIPNVPLPEFEKNYIKIIQEIKKSGSKPVLLSMPPIHADRFFKWVTRGLNAENILKFLGDVGRIYRWHELYNFSVYKIAQQENIPLIDIRQEFLRRQDFASLICEDGMHPSEEGHKLIVDMIEKEVANLQKRNNKRFS